MDRIKMRIEFQNQDGSLAHCQNIDLSADEIRFTELPKAFQHKGVEWRLDRVILTSNKWGPHVVYQRVNVRTADFEDWFLGLDADPMDPNYM